MKGAKALVAQALPFREVLEALTIWRSEGAASVPRLLGMSGPPTFGAYQRTGNPTLAALNCYAEEYPSASGKRVQMRSRAGLEDFKVGGHGSDPRRPPEGRPVRQFGHHRGVHDGLSAERHATLTAQTGTLAGDDLLDIDSGQDSDLNSVARFATGSALYKLQAGGLVLEDFPEAGGAGASSVCYHRGFWLAVEAGTDKVYIQIPGDTTWDPLSFSSAEYAPDALVAVRSRGDQIALMGSADVRGVHALGRRHEPDRALWRAGVRPRMPGAGDGGQLQGLADLRRQRVQRAPLGRGRAFGRVRPRPGRDHQGRRGHGPAGLDVLGGRARYYVLGGSATSPGSMR
jgi:hypothetical protein